MALPIESGGQQLNPDVALDANLLGVPKANSRRYGSTGTITTSSSSQDSSNQSNVTNKFHHISLECASFDNTDSSDESVPLSGHSRESSYSDISADGGGGYYDRFARHRQRSVNARLFIENFLLTQSNFKMILSLILWFASYMIMGVFGGSVAYLHFERSDSSVPEPLPDYGYEVIPVRTKSSCRASSEVEQLGLVSSLSKIGSQKEKSSLTSESHALPAFLVPYDPKYFCPRIPHVPHGNVQSIVLFILYSIILSGVALRWNPQCHPKSGTVICGGDGRLILQHLCHLNCLVFLTRTSTVGLTGLPQPNPKCVEQQHFAVTFRNALQFVMGRGLLPHACGDLIYSGHVGCTLICMAVLHRHGFLKNSLIGVAVWFIALVGIYFTISCRSHYSVDVMLAFYFGYFLPEWYFNRSDGRVRGILSKLIRRLEVRPQDLSNERSMLPSTISV
ncbi:hypothetical protein ACHAWF_005107 [Thalassiosira exigua]